MAKNQKKKERYMKSKKSVKKVHKMVKQNLEILKKFGV